MTNSQLHLYITLFVLLTTTISAFLFFANFIAVICVFLPLWVPIFVGISSDFKLLLFYDPTFFEVYLTICFWPHCWFRKKLIYFYNVIFTTPTVVYVNSDLQAKEIPMRSLPKLQETSRRWVCISDTHESHRYITLPKGDVLIHCGDFLTQRSDSKSSLNVLHDVNKWFGMLNFEKIFCIGGNHDKVLEQMDEEMIQKTVFTNATYKVHDMVKYKGHNVFLSSYHKRTSTRSTNTAFQNISNVNYPDSLSADILITHGPNSGKNLSPAFHFCGHVHSRYGVRKSSSTVQLNCSSCDSWYCPFNPPMVIDIPKEAELADGDSDVSG